MGVAALNYLTLKYLASTQGTSIPAGTPLLIQTGFNVNANQSTYTATITFPQPFPNGCLTVIVCSYYPTGTGTAGLGNYRVISQSATSFQINSATSGQQQTINYIAIGW